jgi:hypothetical protein
MLKNLGPCFHVRRIRPAVKIASTASMITIHMGFDRGHTRIDSPDRRTTGGTYRIWAEVKGDGWTSSLLS